MSVVFCLWPKTRNCGNWTSLLIPTLVGPVCHLYVMSFIVYPTIPATKTIKTVTENLPDRSRKRGIFRAKDAEVATHLNDSFCCNILAHPVGSCAKKLYFYGLNVATIIFQQAILSLPTPLEHFLSWQILHFYYGKLFEYDTKLKIHKIIKKHINYSNRTNKRCWGKETDGLVSLTKHLKRKHQKRVRRKLVRKAKLKSDLVQVHAWISSSLVSSRFFFVHCVAYFLKEKFINFRLWMLNTRWKKKMVSCLAKTEQSDFLVQTFWIAFKTLTTLFQRLYYKPNKNLFQKTTVCHCEKILKWDKGKMKIQ